MKVKVDGRECVTAYKVELPLPPKDTDCHGWRGLLLIDEATDEVQCHVCGGWYKSVGKHASIAHGLTAREYRIRYGFLSNQPLCGKSVSANNRKNGLASLARGTLPKTPARSVTWKSKSRAKRMRTRNRNPKTEQVQNVNGTCDAQLARRYLILADELGSVPTWEQLKQNDKKLYYAIRKRYPRITEFKKLVGVPSRYPCEQYSDTSIIAALRIASSAVKGKYLSAALYDNTRTETMPSSSTVKERLGSWTRGLSMAGLL